MSELRRGGSVSILCERIFLLLPTSLARGKLYS